MLEEKRQTVLFASLMDSAGLYKRLGSNGAEKAMAHWRAIAEKMATEHGGASGDLAGDEVLFVFAEPDAAAETAVQLQRANTDNTELHAFAISTRIALHYGKVSYDGRLYFGDAVNLATRVLAKTGRGQIFTTAETLDRLNEKWRTRCLLAGHESMAGQDVQLLELTWAESKTTIPAESTRLVTMLWEKRQQKSETRMLLTCGLQRVEVTEASPAVVLGRSPQCDMVINHSRVSRLHTRVEYRDGNFYLLDQSANGTYLLIDGEAKTLEHASQAVRGRGLIGLGKAPEAGSVDTIHFSCIE